MKIFMVFLTMYHVLWGLSYFYENSQLEIRQCNTIYAMRASALQLVLLLQLQAYYIV